MTLEAFLDPTGGSDARELDHSIATNRDSVSGKYQALGDVEPWPDFSSARISSNAILRPCLEQQFAPFWRSWVPPASRVIHNERQLENVFLQTLMTRVNIALDMAVPDDEPRVTVVAGLGSFTSYAV